MKLLILGGTVFLGRHLVESGLFRGHSITLFNRGQHNPDLFPQIEKIRGDRDGGLDALSGRSWDAVIDTCGYVPRIVRQSAEKLATAAGRYTFVSSLSVYSDFSAPGMDERSPVGTLQDESVEEITGESYGPLKALCEREVESAFGDRALAVRAGLIVGPHDPTDRFTYWPHRAARGGEMLAPGTAETPVQFVDVRDLADWIVRATESGVSGAVNATGPSQPLPMGDLLDCCCRVADAGTGATWVDEAFLLTQGVTPWSELPLWIPVDSDASSRGFSRISSAKAIESGLTFRPLEETVRDTLAWDTTRPEDYQMRAGLSRDREMALLADWHRQRG